MTAPALLPRIHRPAKGTGLRRVAVGTDFSAGGNRAVQRAAVLLLAPHAALLLVHVLSPGIDPAVASLAEGAAELKLDAIAARLRVSLAARHRGDVAVYTRIVQGKPPDVLSRLARAFGAELLVVGRRGRSRLRELVLGTTARRLLRRGRHPVLVVSRPPEVYRQAVVGLDFTTESLRAARLTRRLMPFQAGLIAAHAYEDPYRDLPLALVPEEAGADRIADVLHERTRLIRRAVETVGRGAKPWQLVVREGDPRRVLLETVAEKGADLVAIGSAGKSRVVRTVLGSVAEGILEAAPCDVLLVRRRPRPSRGS